MREVFDFKDIRRLEDTVLDGIMREGIVVVATSELEAAMKTYYPQYRVFDIHNLIATIIPEWEKDIKDIKNYVMLRKNDQFIASLRYFFERGAFRFKDMRCKDAVLKALSY